MFHVKRCSCDHIVDLIAAFVGTPSWSAVIEAVDCARVASVAAGQGFPMADDVMMRLAETIAARRAGPGDRSYTRQLLDGGPERCARKFGEEAIETVVAGLAADPKALVAEAADVVFHLLVLLEARGLTWSDVAQVLEARAGTSGLDEKAARATKAT